MSGGEGMVVGSLLTAAGTGASIWGRQQGAASTEAALAAKMKQEEVAEKERSLRRTQQLNETLAAQTASAGARGLGSASPSVGAIAMDSIEQYQADEAADQLNLMYERESARAAGDSAQSQADFGSFGDFIGAAGSLFDAAVPGVGSDSGSGFVNQSLLKRAERQKQRRALGG